jgi:hypothetical protein
VTKQQLPSSGILCVTFISSHRASWEAQQLSDTEFDSMWRCLVDPRRLARTAVALEQTLNISFGGSGLGDTAGPDHGDDLGSGGAWPGAGSSSRSSSKSARGAAAAGAMVTGRSWYDVGASMAGSVSGAAGGNGGSHVHAVTDGWKMQLLQVRPECVYEPEFFVDCDCMSCMRHQIASGCAAAATCLLQAVHMTRLGSPLYWL